jgi:hypothetical protein
MVVSLFIMGANGMAPTQAAAAATAKYVFIRLAIPPCSKLQGILAKANEIRHGLDRPGIESAPGVL